jgi:hypothetical protein
MPSYQPSAMQIANRKKARLGGLARARKLSAARRSEIAQKAGNATKDAYGVDLYSYIGKLRKNVGRTRKPVK